jgi:hypothetical protein
MIFCHERFKGDIDIYNSLPLVFNYIASNRRYGHTYYGLIDDMIPLYYISDDEFYIQWENMFLGKFEKDYYIKGIRPSDLWGRSIIVHDDEDDLGNGPFEDSKVTGHSGARIGCAIFGRAASGTCKPKYNKTRKNKNSSK